MGMRRRSFLVDILAKFPRLLGANVALFVVMSLFDAVSFLFIAPIVDLFMNPQVELASPLTRQLAVAIQCRRKRSGTCHGESPCAVVLGNGLNMVKLGEYGRR